MSEDQHVSNQTNASSTTVLELTQIFPGKFAESVAALPQDILIMTEDVLERYFNVTPHDFLIRKNIHTKAKQARELGTTVDIQEIFIGVCSRQNFYKNISTNQHRLAWYLIPIHAYEEMLEESFFHGLKKVRAILDMPLTEKSAPHILKALEFFANRHLGPVIQKIEQKSMNMNVNKTISEREVIDPEEMMQKFAELKSKLATLPQAAVNVDEPT
jgi:hypothetical protein